MLQQRYTALKLMPIQASLEGAEGQVKQYKQLMSDTERRMAAVESRNEQLQSLWSSNKRVAGAARVIQKHYKAWRLRNLKDQTSRDRHVSISRPETLSFRLSPGFVGAQRRLLPHASGEGQCLQFRVEPALHYWADRLEYLWRPSIPK